MKIERFNEKKEKGTVVTFTQTEAEARLYDKCPLLLKKVETDEIRLWDRRIGACAGTSAYLADSHIIVMGLTVALFYQKKPDLVPKKWYGKKVFFTGTGRVAWVTSGSFINRTNKEKNYYYALKINKKGGCELTVENTLDDCRYLAVYPVKKK